MDASASHLSPSDSSAASFVVRSPLTGQPIRTVAIANKSQTEAALHRARLAGRQWADRPIAERCRVLRQARAELVERREQVVELLCAETGKPREDALMEVFTICELIGVCCSRARKQLADQKVKSHLLPHKRAFISYLPRGVVGVIGPYNFPLVLNFQDSIQALLAGNAVIVKPSELAPLAVECVRDALVAGGLPAELLQVIFGMAETAGVIIDGVDMICFTGSPRTGKKVMARAAETLTPVLLELGGKDPMIVLRDANIPRAVNAAVWGGLLHAGQGCVCIERIYVEEPIAEEFTRQLVEKVRQIRQGDGADGRTVDIGATTAAAQLDTIERQLADAVAKGAKILIGGKRRTDLPGQFFEPTVVVGVTHDMALMREETFGPVLPIMAVRDAEEALRLANDSDYGLSSSIFTRDRKRGIELARKIEAGSACVNDCLLSSMVLELPFGGVKQSGVGFRNGPTSLRNFCRSQSVMVDRLGTRSEPLWFPLSSWVGKAVDFSMRFFYGRGRARPEQRV